MPYRAKFCSGKKLLILVNDLGFFLSHRLPIAKAAVGEGYKVTVAYGDLGGVLPDALLELGIKTCHVPLHRGGLNPLKEFQSLYFVWRLFIGVRPDLVHLITIKPYLYGGMVARLVNVGGVISAVAGLGSLFIRDDWRSRFLRAVLLPFYRFAFGHPNQRVIVQNLSDLKVLETLGVLNPNKSILLPGSGVDLSKFKQLHESDTIPTVCFAARLLRDKGVCDFVIAARLLRGRGIKARFWLAGDLDPKNPTGITKLELREIQDEGVVEVLGYQKDIPALYAQSHIVCLPSFYGEGLPKTLVEAAAAGRATVTTDHPGCRDAIIPNISGLLVPVNNPENLANALQWLIEHPRERVAMGKAGREFAEQEFPIEKIVQSHLDIYLELLVNVS